MVFPLLALLGQSAFTYGSKLLKDNLKDTSGIKNLLGISKDSWADKIVTGATDILKDSLGIEKLAPDEINQKIDEITKKENQIIESNAIPQQKKQKVINKMDLIKRRLLMQRSRLLTGEDINMPTKKLKSNQSAQPQQPMI